MTSHLPVKRQSQVRFTVHGNTTIPGISSPPRSSPSSTTSSITMANNNNNVTDPPLIALRSQHTDPESKLAHAEMLQNQSFSPVSRQRQQQQQLDQIDTTLAGVSPVPHDHAKRNDDDNDNDSESATTRTNNNNMISRRSSLASSVDDLQQQQQQQQRSNQHQSRQTSLSRQSSSNFQQPMSTKSNNTNRNNSIPFSSSTSGLESPLGFAGMSTGSFGLGAGGRSMSSSMMNVNTDENNNNGGEPQQSHQQHDSPNTTQAKQISYLQQQLELACQERDLYRNECFTLQQRHRELGICFENQQNELYNTKQQLAALKQKITEAVSAESMRIAQEQVWNDRLRQAATQRGHHHQQPNHEADEMEIKLRALKEETAALQKANSATNLAVNRGVAATSNPYTSMKMKYEGEIAQLKDQLAQDMKITEAMRKDMTDVIKIFYSGLREMEMAVTAAAEGARLPPRFSDHFMSLLNDNTRMGLAKAAIDPHFFKEQLERINRQRMMEKQASEGQHTQGKPIATFDPAILKQQQEAVLYTYSRFDPEHPPPLGCSHSIEAFADEIRASVNRCFLKVSGNVMSVGQDAAAIREILGKTAGTIVDEIRFGLIPQNLFTKDFVKQIKEMADRALREVEFVTETQFGGEIPQMLGEAGLGEHTVLGFPDTSDDEDVHTNYYKHHDQSSKSGVVATPSRKNTDEDKSDRHKKGRRQSSSSRDDHHHKKKQRNKRRKEKEEKEKRRKKKKSRSKKKTGRRHKDEEESKKEESSNMNVSDITTATSNQATMKQQQQQQHSSTSVFTTTNAANRNINQTAQALLLSSPQSLFDPDASIVSQMSSDLNVLATPTQHSTSQANNNNMPPIGGAGRQQNQNSPFLAAAAVASQQQQQNKSGASSTTGSPSKQQQQQPQRGRRGDGMTLPASSFSQQQQQPSSNINNTSGKLSSCGRASSRRSASSSSSSSSISSTSSSSSYSSFSSSDFSPSSSSSSSCSRRKETDPSKRDLKFIIDHLKSRPLSLTMGTPESLAHVSGALTNMTFLLHNNLRVYEDNKNLVERLLNEFYFSMKNIVHVPKRMTSEANSVAGGDD